MKRQIFVFALLVLLLALGTSNVGAQGAGPTPEDNPTSNTGALKSQIQTGGSYDAHSGNGTRIVNDLHVPGALGVYGLDFTRYWNSLHNDLEYLYPEWPKDFGSSGWSHSWRWRAEYHAYSELPADQAEEIFITAILITFPDGHTTTYKIVRGNHPHGFPPQQVFPDPRLGQPYTPGEIDSGWPYAGVGGHDHICNMAVDGSEFWLCLADGGSVHFLNVNIGSGPPNYRATKVFDPHGFRTDLHYDSDGNLHEVLQEGGRSLTINWDFRGGFAFKVIVNVVTGGSAGVQQVAYDYATFSKPSTGNFLTLFRANYLNEPDPDHPGQPVSARYDYGNCYGATESCSGVDEEAPYPMLKYADDPHYAGPMTQIRYDYLGASTCPAPSPPWHLPNFFPPEGYAIAVEKSGARGIPVSSFQLNCGDGTRYEENGLGGRRWFYFGTSAGTMNQPPGVPMGSYFCRSYELGKVTDFAPATGPISNVNHRQNFSWGLPRYIWDGRNIITEQIGDGADDSGLPVQINHPDSSNTRYNRVDPSVSGSAAIDTEQGMHNLYNHWLFSETDELGRQTRYTRDGRRRVTRIEYPGGSAELFGYNNFNQVTSHTLPSGAVMTYDYEPGTGRLLREYNSVDGWEARTDYTYDALEHVATRTDARARSSGAPTVPGRNTTAAIRQSRSTTRPLMEAIRPPSTDTTPRATAPPSPMRWATPAGTNTTPTAAASPTSSH